VAVVEQGKLIESEKQLRAKIEQFRSKREVIKAKEVIKAQYLEDLTAVDDSSPASRRRSVRALRTLRSLPTTPARLTTRRDSSPLMATARLLLPVGSPDL
jgi:hypothetical protein